MKKVVLNSLVSIVFALVISACSWKSPDGYTEWDIMQIAGLEGYDCGYTLGPFVFEGDNYDRLLQAAKNTYFGELSSSEDKRIYNRFKEEFYRCTKLGVNDVEMGKARAVTPLSR